MARTWLIDSRALARKVKNANRSSAYQIKDCGANRECPNCRSRIDNSDVSQEWPGLPAGVKFDPSDSEIIEHLAAKCGVGNSKAHTLIDEFISTLEGDDGICYTHPEYLPGAKKDGTSVHFFHRTMNAYATGQRKRRKIQSHHCLTVEHVRWHKTGKTKSIIENGVQKGCKKIMVLYKASKKGSKPDKSNWVMHQYHLGAEEDEKEGQYVVSKVFYQQQKQSDKNDNYLTINESDTGMIRVSPRTPSTSTPNPPWRGKSASRGDLMDDYAPQSSAQEAEFSTKTSHPSSSTGQFKDSTEYPTWLVGESQAVDAISDSLFCNEILDSYALLDDSGLNHGPFTDFARSNNGVPESDNKAGCGIAELETLELDTPPDFELADLQFGSQDSNLSWLDRS